MQRDARAALPQSRRRRARHRARSCPGSAPSPSKRPRLLPAPPPPRSYDTSNHDRFPVGDPSKRAFTYFVLTGGRFIGAAAVRLAVLKFLLSMTASKDVLAMANLEVRRSTARRHVPPTWQGVCGVRHRAARPPGEPLPRQEQRRLPRPQLVRRWRCPVCCTCPNGV